MIQTKHKIMIILVLCASLAVIVYGIMGIIGAYKITDGCLMRYSSTSPTGNSISTETKDYILRANGNYSYNQPITHNIIDAQGQTQTVTSYGPDPSKYGQWLKIDNQISKTQTVNIKVSGELSLCRAYIPANNIQSASNLDNTNALIPIPRIEETTDPIPLILDAKSGRWNNVLESFRQDKIQIYLGKNHLPVKDANGNIITNVNNVQQLNRFINSNITADCTEGKTSYSPICGRYTPYAGSYISGCNMSACAGYSPKCQFISAGNVVHTEDGTCASIPDSSGSPNKAAIFFATPYDRQNDITVCNSYGVPTTTPLPSYSSTGNVTVTAQPNIASLLKFDEKYQNWNCATQNTTVNGASYQNNNAVWFTASDAAGLIYRFNNDPASAGQTSLGSDISYASILPAGASAAATNDALNLILDTTHIEPLTYLQYRLVNSSTVPASQATGGYVLFVKQTKCYRKSGEALTDKNFTERGRVQYLLLDSSQDPNSNSSLAASAVPITFDSNQSFTLPTNSTGVLWLKISNNPADYADSVGQYTTTINIQTPINGNNFSFFSQIFELFKTKMIGIVETAFKNITCYGQDKSNCTNYFNYIRAVLILFISINALMFLLGMVELNQQELIIKVIKVGFIAGLLNEQTFGYLSSYFIPLVMYSTDQIIANLDGLTMFTSNTQSASTTLENPFTFIDELFTRIFLSPTFSSQLLSLFGLGSHGFIYFIIAIATICIAIIAIFRAAATYIVAFMAQGLLIVVAPIFLSFMLFDYTKYLFEKWLRYIIRYSIEPLIILVGLIVFVKLFTLYLDYFLSYSVCWKCAMSISLPFSFIPIIKDFAITKVPLFCINWFVPWGHDAVGLSGLNMGGLTSPNFTNLIALMITAYGMNGYIHLASAIVTKLAGVEGPSATSVGTAMIGNIGQKMLKQFGLDEKARNKMKGIIKQRISDSRRSERKLNDSANSKTRKNAASGDLTNNNTSKNATNNDLNNKTRTNAANSDLVNNNTRTNSTVANESTTNNRSAINPSDQPPEGATKLDTSSEAKSDGKNEGIVNSESTSKSAELSSDLPKPPTSSEYLKTDTNQNTSPNIGLNTSQTPTSANVTQDNPLKEEGLNSHSDTQTSMDSANLPPGQMINQDINNDKVNNRSERSDTERHDTVNNAVDQYEESKNEEEKDKKDQDKKDEQK